MLAADTLPDLVEAVTSRSFRTVLFTDYNKKADNVGFFI